MENSIKKKNKKKVLKMGLYSIVMSIFAVGVVIGINLFINSLPTNATKFDTTPEEIYSLSEQSVKIAAGVEEQVTIYLLTSSTSRDQSLYEFLQRYASENDNIKIEEKDPVLYPNFAADYTEEDIVSNSVVVKSEKRGKYISYNDIYVSESAMNYTTYQYETTASFDGENVITSALNYVTSEELPVVYRLTGHGEENISDYSTQLETTISNENIELVDLSLVKEGAVPEDASAVLIFAPTKDISEDELSMLRDYEQTGGKIYVLTDFLEEELTNIRSLLADFGMEVVNGIVIEGDAQYYYQYQSYLLPDILNHDITTPLSGSYYLLMGNTQAVQETEGIAENIQVTPLLQTSDEAYSKLDGYDITTYEKEEEDVDGPFYLAAASVITGEDYTAQMVYIPSTTFLSDNINQAISGTNHDFFMNGLEWLCNREDTISIRAKSLNTETLTVDEQTARNWELILMGVIPVALLVLGGIVVYKRRK